MRDELPVVVGVDDMPAGLQVVDFAAGQAAARGAPLRVVHAWPGRRGGSPRRRAFVPDRAEAEHWLGLAVLRAQRVAPGLDVTSELVDGGAAQALIRRSVDAGLMVIGHRDDVGAGHSWGSTAAYLAHHSACPLLVHRGAVPERGPVVVAVSGRRTATPGSAYDAAGRTGCLLVAVHVWSRPESGLTDSDERRAANDRVTCSLSAWDTTWPDVPVRRLLIEPNDVEYTLDRASQRGRLVVAGLGRKGWVVEALYSGGAVRPSRHGLCPVLLVPPGWPTRESAPAEQEAATSP
ncbi:universal stress protein [Actinoplanes sp. GCM10030250]|uniref:universal stress protein n=1 Tax=Actinoplanes sp. GCM10030250 TaxID=3273376 RepID=UPI0036135E20